MSRRSRIVALASPRVASTLDDALEKIRSLMSEAAAQGAEIVCFPEAYVPGLRGQDFEVFPFDRAAEERSLRTVSQWSRERRIAVILGMERSLDVAAGAARQIVSVVIDASGSVRGEQTKNQIDPTEDRFYVPGNTRQIFDLDGLRFGVAICHEGWRYPETVRWAAVRGAAIVFHPQHTGAEREGVVRTSWGEAGAPYYEKAMMCRALENTIYFASVNYGFAYQESATCVVDPAGKLVAMQPYGEPGVLVAELDLSRATGALARRFKPEVYA